jgi:hypothetical protein
LSPGQPASPGAASTSPQGPKAAIETSRSTNKIRYTNEGVTSKINKYQSGKIGYGTPTRMSDRLRGRMRSRDLGGAR